MEPIYIYIPFVKGAEFFNIKAGGASNYDCVMNCQIPLYEEKITYCAPDWNYSKGNKSRCKSVRSECDNCNSMSIRINRRGNQHEVVLYSFEILEFSPGDLNVFSGRPFPTYHFHFLFCVCGGAM